MSERCPTCDRAECPTLAPVPEEAARAYARSHVGPGEHWLHPGDSRVASEADRLVLNQEYDRRRDAGWNCHRHRVDWRAEALRMRPVVEAAVAYVMAPDDDHDTYDLPGLYEAMKAAVDAYRKENP